VCAFWVRPGRVQRAEPLNILTQIPAFHKRPGASRSVSQDQSPGSRVRQRCGSTLCLYLLQLLLRDKLWLQIFLEIWLVLQLRAEIMIRVAALQDEVAYGHRLCPGTNPLDGVSPWRHVDDLDVAPQVSYRETIDLSLLRPKREPVPRCLWDTLDEELSDCPRASPRKQPTTRRRDHSSGNLNPTQARCAARPPGRSPGRGGACPCCPRL
jgi:hypothetical protein